MGIRIDAHELVAEAARDAKTAVNFLPLIVKVVRKVSLDTERAVKRAMPVETGRARASWGHWDGMVIRKRLNQRLVSRKKSLRITGDEYQRLEKQILSEAGSEDSIYEETNGGLTIVQGSNVEYIEVLNEGHSQQASSGFIDVIFSEAELTLNAAVTAAMDTV